MEKNELVIERFFKAPREIVWKAWTDPQYLMQWWGPKDFTAPFCKNELKVGGKYHYCMRSKEGQNFWIAGVFKEYSPFNRLVYTDSFADDKGNIVPASYYSMHESIPLIMEVRIEFENVDGKTKMTLYHTGLTSGEMKEMTRTGWSESFDKLDDFILEKSK
jgi:uncharacterized protein YndB with AHSA1/START domain